MSLRQWYVVFAAGLLSPALALAIKPAHYSFYMFDPGTPPTPAMRAALQVADAILVLGCGGAIIAAMWLAVQGVRRRRYGLLLCPVLVLLHPFLQPVFLGPVETRLRHRWFTRAQTLELVGKTPEEVISLLGNPRRVSRGQGSEIWRYTYLPGYWFGSSAKILFSQGRVRSLHR